MSTPSTSTWPLLASSRLPAIVEQRALAGAARAHDGDELAALDGKVDRAQRLHLAWTRAVDLRHLAQFQCACHCETSIVRVGSRGRSTAGVGARGRQLLQADIGGVKPADDRLEPEQLGVGDECQRHVVLGRSRLDLGVALHDFDRVPAVHLQDLENVDPRNLEGHQHLDHELVTRGRDERQVACEASRRVRGRPRR